MMNRDELHSMLYMLAWFVVSQVWTAEFAVSGYPLCGVAALFWLGFAVWIWFYDVRPAPAALDGRFGKARAAAGVGTMDFQFRDLRAKAATETEDARGMDAAQALLGHASSGMTRQYVRRRLGRLVEPTK